MYKELLNELNAQHVTLVAVSKTHTPERILELYQLGQRVFGENRVQELVEKAKILPSDIEWHLIGHLQTNKAKYVASFVSMIHAVDSLKLLKEINKQARNADRKIDCLLQFHIAQEDTKFGLSEKEACEILENASYLEMQHVRICGVMGMASFTDNKKQVREELQQLRAIFNRLKEQYFQDAPYFKEISMGMSSDWKIAVEEGSTMVRIGSLIFGSRG